MVPDGVDPTHKEYLPALMGRGQFTAIDSLFPIHKNYLIIPSFSLKGEEYFLLFTKPSIQKKNDRPRNQAGCHRKAIDRVLGL